MAERIPLGEREHRQLEFKAVEALRKPETIGREVVGMLNAAGGKVWIGVSEEDGIATRIENIPHPDRAKRALLDHLIETIEPAFRDDEVWIEDVTDDSGTAVLLVHVRPSSRTNRSRYAYRTRNGRYFGIRVGDRLRTMTWQEIFAQNDGAGRQATDGWQSAAESLTRELDRRLEDATPRYWLALKPVAAMNLRFGEDTKDLFRDPLTTKNRANGWNFVDPHLPVHVTAKEVVHGDATGRMTVVRRDGSIEFSAPLEYLHWKGEPRLIWPYILIEFTVSIFRLASHLYAGHRHHDERVATQLALVSAAGWCLKAGSVKSVRWSFDDPRVLAADDAISELKPSRLDEIMDTPDHCAYPLIADIYADFGLAPADVPSELDPVAGLAFPS